MTHNISVPERELELAVNMNQLILRLIRVAGDYQGSKARKPKPMSGHLSMELDRLPLGNKPKHVALGRVSKCSKKHCRGC